VQNLKMQDMKMQDMKLQDKISTILSTQEAQKRAWPHGTSATPSRCQSRHTSQQLSTAAADVTADVEVVPVAAARDAVAGGRSCASSSSLVDSLWCHID